MTPTEFATVELRVWERALQEQRDAEWELERARVTFGWIRIPSLRSQVEALRTCADLLLASAVRTKCMYRDGRVSSETRTTIRELRRATSAARSNRDHPDAARGTKAAE